MNRYFPPELDQDTEQSQTLTVQTEDVWVRDAIEAYAEYELILQSLE